MKDRPILFRGAMVRALLDGTKAQTRRLVKHIPALGAPEEWCAKHAYSNFGKIVGDYRRFCPYGQPGDRLWVRETFTENTVLPLKDRPPGDYIYRADLCPNGTTKYSAQWKPSIFCKRVASRITLELTEVRVERLNDISEADARAEGVTLRGSTRNEYEGRFAYQLLWEDINGFGSWAQNPWVWVVTFKRITP